MVAGRGTSRGRGRGAAARGRGAKRGRGGQSRQPRRHKSASEDNAPLPPSMDMENFDINAIDKNQLFVDAATPFSAHAKAQEQNKWLYLATMLGLKRNGVELLQVAKVRALAAAWARHDHELADTFLSDSDTFGVVEVLKALTLLDSGRRARTQERLIVRLSNASKTAGRKGKSRLGRKIVGAKKNMNNLKRDKPTLGSASGAVARHVRRWARRLDERQLQFFALHLPTETWRQMADIVHFKPAEDFPGAPWFLPFCYDSSKAPAGSLAAECAGITADNVNEFVARTDVPFSHIKQHAARLNNDSKARIARYTDDVAQIIWNYEDLRCDAVDAALCERLNGGEAVRLPYGKLMERLLVMRKLRHRDDVPMSSPRSPAQDAEVAPCYTKLLPLAQRMLADISIPVESPVVVIGDASASMDVAIQTSTIIASFLRALTNAQLVFFSNDAIEPAFLPVSVEEVLDLAMVTKTVGCTCHAAALWPFYERKEVVKTFIVCTDEEENTDFNAPDNCRYRFQPLFAKYHAEVYPAKLVFVSFLHSQHSKGQMVEPLKAAGYHVMQFKLDHNRPDLTKLNNLVGQLSVDSVSFADQINRLEASLREEGIRQVFERLNL